MVAFVTSVVITALMAAGIVAYAQRRPAGVLVTWGEAMLAATYVFLLLLLAYGVVPNQWIQWTTNELDWSSENLFEHWSVNWLPFEITLQAVRDIVVIVIHVIALGANVVLWVLWQDRGKAKPTVEPVSDFGRPLLKQT